MIRTIPLNKLVASPRNVRRSTDPEADLELKADIEAHGLLQNLVVSSVRKPKGCFAVEAGERRRKALAALAGEGKLAKDHAVSCLVVDADAAQEASLAENFQRLAMNPADECLAFSALAEQGVEAGSIARRFGVTVRFVEGRLRLASLAPIVFEALGAGEISLDVAKAYAATPDAERQAHVFEQVGQSYMSSHPDSIRRMMTQATVSAGDRRARFVGEDAYGAAGGRIERDLFASADDARWLDVALLERLATEKLDALAQTAAAEHGLAFVRPTLDSWIGYPATEGLRRVTVETPPLTDEEAARVDALEAEIGELVGMLEDEDTGDEARSAAEEKIAMLDREIDAITDKAPVIDGALRGTLGTFLMLDCEGRPKLDTGFYAEIGPEDGADDAESDQAGRQIGAAPSTQLPRAAGLPRQLVDELAIQRRDILARHVAADPDFALELGIFLMIDRAETRSTEWSGSTLSAARPSNPVSGFRTPDARAMIAEAEASEALDRSWTKGDTRGERFDAFRALSDAVRMAWLGEAVARTLEASTGLPGERACAFHDHLGMLLGIDVAAWWRPTGGNYFDRVPKLRALAALAEVGGPTLAGPHRLVAAPSPWTLSAGTVIPASLITGLNSDLPGMVLAQVTENVRDSATGRTVLVPQGARLIGKYDSVVAFGQRRALLIWTRIVRPDGSSVELDHMPATDASGYSGVSDGVDSHGWQLLKGIGMSTLLGIGTQLSFGGSGSDLVRALRESTQENVAHAGDQITSRNLDIQPTITVRPGWPVRALVNKDLVLQPWRE